MTIWRDGDARYATVAGTGSISCLGLTAEEGAAAEARRQPLGFAQAVAIARERNAAVEAELRDLGECLWTARDTFMVADNGHAKWVINTAFDSC